MAGITIPLITEFKDKGIKQAMKEFKALETTGKKAQFALKKAAMPAIAALGALAVVAKSAVGEASDLGESINAVAVVFGKSSKEILKLSKAASKSVGLSRKDFNSLAVQFSSFARTIAGKGGDVSAVIKTMTLRSADFASVMNIDVAEAARKFQSGLAGESEPLKKYGIDISAAAIETFAYANGIAIAGEKLTEQQKVLARYGSIMEQTNKTAGDFANTSGSLANQTRILDAQMTDFKASLGEALLPILEKVTPLLLKMVDWAVNNQGVFLAIAGAVGILAVSILAVNAAMLLNPAILITAGIVAIGVAIVVAYKKFETFRKIVDTVFAGIKAAVNFGIEAWKGYVAYVKFVLDAATKVLQFFRNDVWGVFKQIVTGVASIMGGVVNALVAPFKAAFNGIARAWNDTIGKFSVHIPTWVPKIGGNGFDMPDIPYLADGGIVTGPTLAMIGEKGPEAVIPLTGRNAGVGATNYITVNVSGADPQAVVQALQKYVRQSGPVPVNIRNM